MLAPMWTFVWGTAVAGTLGANLEQVARAPQGLAVSCGDGAAARLELARLGPLVGEAEGLGGGRLAPAFRPGVPVVAAVDPAAHRVEVAFPSALGAEPVAQALAAADPDGVATFTAEGWVVTTGDDVAHVRVDAGWAHVVVGPGAEAELAVRGGPDTLLAALPHAEGCLLLGRLPPDEDGSLGGDFGVHFPLGGEGPIRFAVTGAPAELASVIPLDPQPARTMRTRLPPAAVASVGVAFDRIDLRFFLRGAELAKGRALQRALPVTAGVLVAIVGDGPGDLEAAAVLPLAPVGGAVLSAKAVARRATRVFRSLKFPVERLDDTHLRARLEGGDWLWLAGVDGALHLSTGQRALAEMELGEGEPWAQGAFADQSGRFPVVLSSWVAPDPDGAPVRLDQPISLAVGVHQGVVTGELVLALSPMELLGALAGMRSWLAD